MPQEILYVLVFTSIVCITLSIFIVVHLYRKASLHHPKSEIENTYKTKWWFIILWLFFYVITGVIVLYQAQQKVANREASDVLFVIAPSIFMMIGSAIHYQSRKRKVLATEKTIAKVTGLKRTGRMKNSTFAPQYEFYANGKQYHVTSRNSTNHVPVSVGSEIELFYIPDDPEKIYVPKEVKALKPMIYILYFFGVGFPLSALFAPILRIWM